VADPERERPFLPILT